MTSGLRFAKEGKMPSMIVVQIQGAPGSELAVQLKDELIGNVSDSKAAAK
jgi:hypothetical protein